MDEQQHNSSDPQPNMQAYSGMQPAGQYNSNGHHAPDSYRASPSQQHSHGTPLLPPIHNSYEGTTMQSQQPYLPQQMNGAQMPHPPPYNPHQFQYPNGAMQPAPMLSNAGMNGQRFAIPPQAAIPIGAARGAKNKEVKRRTKTGCLTCRKRRIKCDEAQPACRNCAKSKRECMGYDPIFKQTTGPAPIQPAPASATTPTPKSAPTSATLPSNTYQSFPGTGGTFIATPSNTNQSHFDSPFEYGPSLDPALGPGDAALTMAANSYSSALLPARQVKHISIDQLFSLNGVAPQYQKREAPPPGSTAPQAEIDNYYKFHYAPGLDRIFETTWYSTRGLSYLQQDPSLLDFLSQCMERMTSSHDETVLRPLEARLVWKLAVLPRSASNTSGMNGASTDQLTSDLLPRIDTLESLLTGQFLPETSIPPQSDPSPQSSHSFWHNLGYFTSIHDDTSDSNNHHNINDALIWLRGILHSMENRDVLYSIAIARYIGGRYLEFNPPNRVSAQTDDPNDEVKKLQVAHDFVASEDQKGTTQVIQRICGMAMRSWILQKQ